jgi:uncharacterized membrane protein YgaE (UPF0421/DUF939 family)
MFTNTNYAKLKAKKEKQEIDEKEREIQLRLNQEFYDSERDIARQMMQADGQHISKPTCLSY